MFIVYASYLDLICRKITERNAADEVKLKTWTYETYVLCHSVRTLLNSNMLPSGSVSEIFKIVFLIPAVLWFITQSHSGYS